MFWSLFFFWGGFGFYPPGSVSNHFRFNDRRDREQQSASYPHGHSKQSRSRFPYSDDLIIIPGGGKSVTGMTSFSFLSCVIGGILFLLKKKKTFFWKRGAVIRNGNNRKPSIPPPPQGMIIKIPLPKFQIENHLNLKHEKKNYNSTLSHVSFRHPG